MGENKGNADGLARYLRAHEHRHPARRGHGRGRAGGCSAVEQPPALRARTRRPAGAQRHRGAAVPRRDHVDAGRLPRRRRLLRDQRLPHHVAAPRGGPQQGPRQPGPVLPAPGAPPAPGAVPRAGQRVAVQHHLPARRGPCAARRRRRGARLRDELVADRSAPVLHRRAGTATAPAPPVVTRGGGAVLPGVADAARRHVEALAAPAPHDDRGHARGDHRVVRHDGRLVVGTRLHGRGSVPRLLRHRHAHLHHAHRRGARDGVVTVAAPSRHPAPAAARAGRGRRDRARPARAGVRHRALPVERALPRRLPPRRPPRRDRDRGRGPSGVADRDGRARPAAAALARRAVLRDLPLALADLHGHPSRRGHRPRRMAQHGAPDRAHAGRGRAVVPVRRGADPPRVARPVVRRPAAGDGRGPPLHVATHARDVRRRGPRRRHRGHGARVGPGAPHRVRAAVPRRRPRPRPARRRPPCPVSRHRRLRLRLRRSPRSATR